MIRCLHHCDVKLLQTSTKSTRQRTTSPTLTPISPTQFPEPGDGVTSVHQARHAIGLNHSARHSTRSPPELSLAPSPPQVQDLTPRTPLSITTSHTPINRRRSTPLPSTLHETPSALAQSTPHRPPLTLQQTIRAPEWEPRNIAQSHPDGMATIAKDYPGSRIRAPRCDGLRAPQSRILQTPAPSPNGTNSKRHTHPLRTRPAATLPNPSAPALPCTCC
jgi:hypothetical protein